MKLNLLLERYLGLQEQLSAAYRRQPWDSSKIDELADALVAAELALAGCPPTPLPVGEGYAEARKSSRRISATEMREGL
jgi:hypothetical protein